MANLSKIKRDNMIAFLEELKKTHSDDASIRAFNEIENYLREKKYGLVWEEHSEEVDELLAENIPVLTADPERRLCKDENLPWNFIIEGDNLQALYLLEKTHKGKVDCIYIDPPYNTGAKDWKYNNDYVDGNDVYRHSKWLSMMKNRLQIAKNLLNPFDSVLIVTIDEKEYLHLGCLLEEMFPTARIQMISSVINPSGSARKNIFSRAEEYIYYVFIGDAKVYPNRTDMIHPPKEDLQVRWASLLRSGSNSSRSSRPNLFYPVFFNCETGKYVGTGASLSLTQNKDEVDTPVNCFAVWPMKANGEEARWTLSQDTLADKINSGFVKFGSWKKGERTRTISYLSEGMERALNNGELEILGKDEDGTLITGRSFKPIVPLTIWNQPSHGAGDFGSSLLLEIFKSKRFTFPKSLYAVRDTLNFVVKGKKDAVIIDFFAGSGTTLHAVNLLNAEDSGNRICIMVTNNEISAEEEKEFLKQGISKGSEEWESRGIAKHVTWPRTVCTINGVNINGERLTGEYFGTDVPMATGFNTNVKYFKCDWTPRKPEDYLLSNVLCLHIREMIELQNAIEVDNVKNVLILNKSDFKNTILDPDIYARIENVWVNQNIVLNAEELKLLEAKGFRYIPREFFGQELREAAE
jgi:adenine-specific DNA-methyltransferase